MNLIDARVSITVIEPWKWKGITGSVYAYGRIIKFETNKANSINRIIVELKKVCNKLGNGVNYLLAKCFFLMMEMKFLKLKRLS